ncbi:MAG: hypothetical protein KDA32_06310 [Phycisphaerales bacterium]|nr:hypothetical protein [Phycisphaerales bacterium]
MRIHSAVLARTGEFSSNTSLAKWLRRSGIDLIEVPDAVSLCAAACTRLEAPDLAVIGSDWIQQNERQVVDYVRQAWPDAIILVHGRDADAYCGRSTMTIDSPAKLQRLLATAPDIILTEYQAYMTVSANDVDEGRASLRELDRGAGALTATRR